MTLPIEVFDAAVAILGKTGRKLLPPALPRGCWNCFFVFQPRARKFFRQRFCCRGCSLQFHKPVGHNAKVARASATSRGDAQRGRGAGKSYRKLNGRHEHRVIAEQALGRALMPGEIVHHDDHDKRNNAPGNLEVLPSQAEHCREHRGFPKRRRTGGTSRFKGVHRRKDGKWQVTVYDLVNRRRVSGGAFADEDAAGRRYDSLTRQLNGDRAITNFQATA